jgi:predicted acyl esterase
MDMGKRLATAGAITATLALAGVVGTSSASAIPPKGLTVPGVAAAPAPEPAPAVPTFVNGMSQPVFSASPVDWVTGEVWVESNFDTDGDGKLDRMHTNYTIPKETQTDGLKVPVIYEDSPYFAGTGAARNWLVDHEIGSPPASRLPEPFFNGANTSPNISNEFESPWLSRGYGVVHSESPGTGYSDGCPTSGGVNETQGATVVIDWLNGRRKAYTTRAGTIEAPAVTWHNGKTAMMGTSYNGTIPVAAASTGVDGLAAIVPISAISDWYDYYRANGMVRAPHSAGGGTGTNSYLGEDLDVLADVVYSRRDEQANPPGRTICLPTIRDITSKIDRATGDRSAFWQERNYMKDVAKIKAATLIAHGGNDFNVMTKNAAQLYAALRAQGTPHMFYFHQGNHGGAPPDFLTNLWFTKYLYGQDNGVENLAKSWVVREAATCPPRETTVTGDQSNTMTLTVAGVAPFRVGYTLTIPQTNTTTGAITSTTRVITNIAGNTLTLASAVAVTDQKVANGAIVSLLCNTNNPTPYAEWPDPATANAVMKLLPGGASRGNLTFGAAGSGTETLIDDATQADTTLVNAATSPNRLIYVTNPLTQDVRISGSPRVSLKTAYSKTKANLSAALISFPATGNGTILTRGWMDPENPTSDFVSEPITPGAFRTLSFDMQAKDAIVPAGRRLGLMVFSSDRQYTVRPAPGTEVSLDLAGSQLTLPVVGGPSAFAAATGTGYAEAPVSGAVPATLSLTLGAPASFGAFTPGMAKEYTATTNATVISSAGDATLSVADPSTNHPGYLVNGAFALPQPLQGLGTVKTYSAPVSNDVVPVTFKQAIGQTDALRTGAYSKTLTFTLSTTTP